jgi:pyridoxal phosphate enzyme (YggS family)
MRKEGAFVSKKSALAERLDEVNERIAAACARAKRDRGEVTLIAVTKTASPEQVREIVQLGVGDLGESRVQVLTQRAAQINEFYQRRVAHGESGLPSRLRWHMIGHLQRNKVKPILPLVSCIHSVDSLRLAEEIDTHAARIERRIPVMLEVNAGDESGKFGVAVGAAVHLAEQIDSMSHLQLVGLMSMAPQVEDPETVRPVFARAREVFEEMKWHKIGGTSLRHLSMGMSNDFEVAIAEGATMVRIGSLLFGGKSEENAEE